MIEFFSHIVHHFPLILPALTIGNGDTILASDFPDISPGTITPGSMGLSLNGQGQIDLSFLKNSIVQILQCIPKPISSILTTTSETLSSTTTMSIGVVHLTNPMAVNKIILDIAGAQSGAGSILMGIWSEDGQTQYYANASIAIPNSGGGQLVTISPTTFNLPAGNFYIGFAVVSGSGTPMFVWTGAGILDSSTKNPVSGTYTITAGTVPATITPGSISYASGHAPIILLTN